MTDFKEGDTAFALATVGLAFVPEQCSFGSGDGEAAQCMRLGGFLVGVDCTDDEEGYQTCFVVCADHLGADLVMLARDRIERECQYAETLVTAWIARSRFLDHEVGRDSFLDHDLIKTAPDFYETVERFGLTIDEDAWVSDDDEDEPEDEGVNDLTATYYYTHDDDVLKPWKFKCDCGYFEMHATESAVQYLAKKHTEDGHAYFARPA